MLLFYVFVFNNIQKTTLAYRRNFCGGKYRFCPIGAWRLVLLNFRRIRQKKINEPAIEDPSNLFPNSLKF